MIEWITKYWIQAAFGLVTTGLLAYIRYLSKQIKKERSEQKALRDGMRALLRRQIIADCEAAVIAGYCEVQSKDTIRDMYDSYSALGGNGTVTALKNQIMGLPVVRNGGHE